MRNETDVTPSDDSSPQAHEDAPPEVGAGEPPPRAEASQPASEQLSSDRPQPDQTRSREDQSRSRGILTSVLWTGHWILRIWLAGYLLVYGWTKVFLMQMGHADFADALVQFGEMSPMGLLWRFMAFSPTVQFLAGLAEVAAAVLLLVRRTAWLGAVVATVDMTVVFLLNLTFDVPVKQLSGLMALAGLIVLIPHFARLARFVLGLPTSPPVRGTIVNNRRFLAITRWTSLALAGVLVVGSGVAFGMRTNWGQLDAPPEIAGVYRVAADGARTFEGSEISQVAFSQIAVGGKARVSIRYTDGTFQDGAYTVENNTVALSLYPKLQGDQGLVRDVATTADLHYAVADSGEITLTGEGLDLTLVNDPERRYLFDRDFSWAPREPINR